ncbi:MAG: diguanylate cyclase [Syntrophaceae bacterium]|nr:diguanylate cyclase [Syntrophaceae bacterium]
MIKKKRRFALPSFSVRSNLLLILFLPALSFWLYISLIADTIKTIIISGTIMFFCFLATWCLGETLLIGRMNRLIAALRSLFKTLATDDPVTDCHGVDIETLTACINRMADTVMQRRERQLQEIEILKKSQKKWLNIIDSLPDATFAIDIDGKVIVWNHAIEELTGIKATAMIGKGDREYAVPFYRKKRNMLIDYVFLPLTEIEGGYSSVKKSGTRLYGEGVIQTPRSGKPIFFWGMASPLYDNAGHLVGAIETIRDITGYKETEKALLDGRAKYQALFDSANDAVTLMVNDVFIDCNHKALTLFGCSKEALVGQTPQRVSPLQQPNGKSSAEAALEKISGALQGTPQFFSWTHCRLDGTPFETEISLDAVRLQNGEVIIQSIIRDITERKQTEETIRQFAYHDPLTGLPNRRLLYDRFSLEIANAARGKRTFTVMMFDIDHFKNINDTLGHHAGDLLLQNVAYRIRSNLRKGDTLARFGGDEFIVLLPEVTRDQEALPVAQKLLKAFKRPFNCDNHDVFVTTSIGIALYPEDGLDMEALIRHADRALYRSKNDGRDTFTFFGTLTREENDLADVKEASVEPES